MAHHANLSDYRSPHFSCLETPHASSASLAITDKPDGPLRHRVCIYSCLHEYTNPHTSGNPLGGCLRCVPSYCLCRSACLAHAQVARADSVWKISARNGTVDANNDSRSSCRRRQSCCDKSSNNTYRC